MNDDFDADLDARLRDGARAFPPGPTPATTQLREVLTASRRRSRRTHGTVLACATAAVAGGAALVLREPSSSVSVEMASPASTTTAPGDAAPPWDERIRGYICGPEHFVPVSGARSPDVLYLMPEGAGASLPEDLVLTIDGVEVLAPGASRGTGGDPSAPPTVADGQRPSWALVMTGAAVAGEPLSGVLQGSEVMLVLSPVPPGPHEVEITIDGESTTLELVDAGTGDWGAIVGTEPPGLEVEWVQLDGLCATEPTDPAPPPTGPAAPPTTVVAPTTVVEPEPGPGPTTSSTAPTSLRPTTPSAPTSVPPTSRPPTSAAGPQLSPVDPTTTVP